MTPEDVQTVEQFLKDTTEALNVLGDWHEETHVTESEMVISVKWDGFRSVEEVEQIHDLFIYAPRRNEILAALLLAEVVGDAFPEETEEGQSE